MKSMWKATLVFLVIVLLLLGGGLIGGNYVFEPWERILAETPSSDGSEARSSGLSEKEYKKIRLAFNSFDLAAGLTRSDFEAIPANNTYYFGFLWLGAGMMIFLTKPRKNKGN